MVGCELAELSLSLYKMSQMTVNVLISPYSKQRNFTQC